MNVNAAAAATAISGAPLGGCSKLLRQLNDSAPIIKLKRAKNFAKSDAKDETFLFNIAAAESIFILSRKLLRTVCVCEWENMTSRYATL